jgi:hypothetical protein
MRQALKAACARGSLESTDEQNGALLEACGGRLGSAFLSLQVLCARAGLGSTAASMSLDTSMRSARETARIALQKGAELHHAAADVEGVLLAVHAAIPTAAAYAGPQVASRLAELRKARASAGQNEAVADLEAESLAAMAASLDALGMQDMAEKRWARDPSREALPQLGAYMAAEGVAAPMRAMRDRRGLSKTPVDMGQPYSFPEYFKRKGEATRALLDMRDTIESKSLEGCEITASSAKKGPTCGVLKTVLLPPHLQNLDHVRPSQNVLLDYCGTLKRPWIHSATKRI